MSDAGSGSGILRLRRTIPLLFGEKNLTQVPKLKIVLVLVLDLLGLCVETRPQFSRANSLHERDAEVTRLLEHETSRSRFAGKADHPFFFINRCYKGSLRLTVSVIGRRPLGLTLSWLRLSWLCLSPVPMPAAPGRGAACFFMSATLGKDGIWIRNLLLCRFRALTCSKPERDSGKQYRGAERRRSHQPDLISAHA
jgi:hypothetical protein